jgi:CBS domain-containing protein
MRGIPWTLRPDDPVERAVDIMDRHGLLHLVVLDETRQPVGLLSRHDLLRLAVAAPEKPVVVAGP